MKRQLQKITLLALAILGGVSSAWAEINTDAAGRKQYVWDFGCVSATTTPSTADEAYYFTISSTNDTYSTTAGDYGTDGHYDIAKIILGSTSRNFTPTGTPGSKGAGAVLEGSSKGYIEFYAPVDGIVTLTGMYINNAKISVNNGNTKVSDSKRTSAAVTAGQKVKIYYPNTGGCGIELVVLTENYYNETVSTPTAVEYMGTSIRTTAGTASWTAGATTKVVGTPSEGSISSTMVTSNPDVSIWYAATADGAKTEVSEGSVTPGSTGTYYIFTKSASGTFSEYVTCDVTGYITETYDFKGITTSPLTTANVKATTLTLDQSRNFFLPSSDLSVFNNRFGFYSFGNWKGNNSQGLKIYNNSTNAVDYMAILGLKTGDKVAVSFNKGTDNPRLKVYTNNIGLESGSALNTDQEYTVTADGDLGFEVHTGGRSINGGEIEIYSVTIKHPVANTPNKPTISAWGWNSYSSQQPVKFTGSTKAYMVTSADNETATLTEVTTIRPYTGVLINGTASTEAVIDYADIAGGDSYDDTSSNLLVGLPYSGIAKMFEGYVLSATSTENSLGFYHLTSSYGKTPNRYSAYLPESAVSSAREFIALFDNNNETTGIANVIVPTERDNQFYNMNGMRVNHPQKGLYIFKGKKVIIK
ncbi:MAG: hypothetical protein IJ844_06265 [Prevotella sp.]|nr:hypothetical protein [Prevotella sp.]